MTKPHISLLIPDLFACIDKAQSSVPRLKALETLLARADRSTAEPKSYYPCISELMGLECESKHIPVAAVSRYADSGLKDQRVWMHVDPVYIEADKDRLILRGNSMLDLDTDESSTLLQGLNDLYAEDGWQFESYNNERWYVSLTKLPASSFHSLSDARGRSVEPFMPSGADQTHWHRFINEVQMYLHAAESNQQRLEQQQYPVNSVWCWGPGQLPDSIISPWQAVYTDEPFCKGLAMLAGVLVYSPPPRVESVIEENSSDQINRLVVLSPDEADMLSMDTRHHTDRLIKLETAWFKPLLQALKQGRIASLGLQTCEGHCYRLKKLGLSKIWRRRRKIRPLSSARPR